MINSDNLKEIQELSDEIDLEIGREIGRKEGFDIGFKEGLEEVRQQRLQEAAEKTNQLFVTNLLSNGSYTIKKIAEYVGVSENYVRKIKRRLNP